MLPAFSFKRFYVWPILFALFTVITMAGARSVVAGELPIVPGAAFDGTNLYWDTLDEAKGYNIFRNRLYLDTVIDSTRYKPFQSGNYQISAFDGNGNYTPVGGVGQAPTVVVSVDIDNKDLVSPQNVLGTVYSNNAGEISWDRSPIFGIRYLVNLNGVALGDTDGVSLWIDSLLVNAQNLVSVTAITADGSESRPITLLFDTSATGFPAPATNVRNDEPPGTITSPQNPVLETYSFTSAELFWDRAPASDNVVTTEVFRNNEFIGTSPGTSFYDNTRMRNTNYTYALIAVDQNGSRSATAFINPGPLDGNTEEVVLNVLTGISEATFATPHTTEFPKFQALLAELTPDNAIDVDTQTNPDGVAVTTTTYDCGDGLLSVASTEGVLSTTLMSFIECDIQDLSLVDGTLEISYVEGQVVSVSYGELFFYAGDLEIYLDGNVSTQIDQASATRSINYNGFRYDIVDVFDEDPTANVLVVMDQTVAYAASSQDAPSTLTTKMTVNAFWTGGRDIVVTTDNVFSSNGTSNYTAGSLRVETDLGESLQWSADTGDAGTWYAEVNTVNGTSGSNGNWSSLIRLPCIVLDGDCE